MEDCPAWFSLSGDISSRPSGFLRNNCSQQGCADFRWMDRASGIHVRAVLGNDPAVERLLASSDVLVDGCQLNGGTFTRIRGHLAQLSSMADGLVRTCNYRGGCADWDAARHVIWRSGEVIDAIRWHEKVDPRSRMALSYR